MIKKILPLFILTTLYLNLSAQQLFDSLLNISSTKYPQEKIYLQLDKSYYHSGETIWFKAYITALNMPSSVSKTLYAELINSEGKVLQRKTMPVFLAGAASFFELADSNYNSKLFIRAYTSWMLNFDPALLYLKPITVINAKPPPNTTVPKDRFTLTLFPEGGDLIENISCRMAFKANNQSGIPFAVVGTVTDSKGKKISSFASTHDGMGFFEITPAPDEKYSAVWNDINGLQHLTPLPAAKKTGLSLRIDNNNNRITYTLTRPENADDAFRSFIVVAQMHQQTVYSAKINMRKKTQIAAPIITDSLPNGVVQLTVFNDQQLPVAERIAFVNNNNYSFTTDLHAVEKNLAKHGKSVLQVDVGGKLFSNLSIAVTDAGLDVEGNDKDNIFSSQLLSSDCKGYIYNAAYYFSGDEDSVKQQLDLVMMTNGWRRFNWEDLLANKWPKLEYLPDDYLSLRGKIYGLSKDQLRNRELTAILKNTGKKNGAIFSIPVNESGNIYASGLYFFDTAQLFYQFNNDKDKTLTSRASFTFSSGLGKTPPIATDLLQGQYFNPVPDSSILKKSININALYRSEIERQRTKTLQAVIVKTKERSLQDKLEKEYTSGFFTGGNARVFTTEDDPFAQASGTILDYLRGRVAGLQINTNGEPSITRRGNKTEVFLDEITTDIGMLQTIPMTDVAMIKVFDPPFFGSFGGGPGGAVAVYTKKGGNRNDNIKGLNEVTLYGYSSVKEFYMPDYDKPNNSDIVDYRSTLYWNPFLLIDAQNRRVTIPIFNSDKCKKMKVIIEGMNEAGQLTREEKVFE